MKPGARHENRYTLLVSAIYTYTRYRYVLRRGWREQETSNRKQTAPDNLVRVVPLPHSSSTT